MEIRICKTKEDLGKSAAAYTAEILRAAIAKKGYARIVLSTGASQFDTISALVKEDVDWTKVDMFHLDEYVALPITHPASFRKYLQERFVDLLPTALRSVNFVDGTPEGIAALTAKLRPFKLPGGKVGAYIVGGVAIITLIFGFIFGLYPSDPLSDTMTVVYIIGVFLAVICISVLPPFIIEKWFKKDSWMPTEAELEAYENATEE